MPSATGIRRSMACRVYFTETVLNSVKNVPISAKIPRNRVFSVSKAFSLCEHRSVAGQYPIRRNSAITYQRRDPTDLEITSRPVFALNVKMILFDSGVGTICREVFQQFCFHTRLDRDEISIHYRERVGIIFSCSAHLIRFPSLMTKYFTPESRPIPDFPRRCQCRQRRTSSLSMYMRDETARTQICETPRPVRLKYRRIRA